MKVINSDTFSLLHKPTGTLIHTQNVIEHVHNCFNVIHYGSLFSITDKSQVLLFALFDVLDYHYTLYRSMTA